MKLTIYHNPRCRKSREALHHLEENNYSIEVIDYLKETLSPDEIKTILSLLNYSPEELIRKNEAIWKSDFKGTQMTDNEVIQALSDYPKLIERPIISNGQKAVIARPIEKLINFLK